MFLSILSLQTSIVDRVWIRDARNVWKVLLGLILVIGIGFLDGGKLSREEDEKKAGECSKFRLDTS